MAGLKRTTMKLIAARKKANQSGGKMYHDIKKFPMVAGARKSAANAIKRLKAKHGSKTIRRRLMHIAGK